MYTVHLPTNTDNNMDMDIEKNTNMDMDNHRVGK